jgi:hypothetical protein
MNTRMSPARTTGSFSARVAEAWADWRYANKRLFELQLDPTGRQSR